jgi:Delta7-sterol 5-desaturase
MIQNIFENSPFWLLGLLVTGMFAFLYFFFALLGYWLSRHILPKYKIGASLQKKPIPKGQISLEIRLSLISVAIFGFWGMATQWGYQMSFIVISWNTTMVELGIEYLVLFFWNDIHFYACHWLLHRRWLYRKVHYLHHLSLEPTPFSTYSFHWFEAFLLGSVMFVALLIYPFHWLPLVSLPILSLFINTLGHWHYELFPNTKMSFLKFSVHHSLHHAKFKGNFGFFLNWFDKWFGTEIK